MIKEKFRFGSTIFLVVLILLVPGISGWPSIAPGRDVLNILVNSSGGSIYGSEASAGILNTFNSLVVGSLLSLGEDQEIHPAAISEWGYNFKNKTYVLSLREGLRFQSGRIATSEDLEFALLRGFFSKKPSFFMTYLGQIEGVDKINSGMEYRTGIVKGIRLVNKRTIEVKLKASNPFFLYSLTVPYFGLVDRFALKENFIDWKGLPSGIGDWKAIEETESLIRLKPSKPSRYSEINLYKKYIPSIRYDISFEKVSGLAENFPPKPRSIVTISFSRLNELSKYWAFKKAIALSIDKLRIEKNIPGTKATDQLLPGELWRLKSGDLAPNVVEAKALWKTLPRRLTARVWNIPVFSSGKFSSLQEKYTSFLSEDFEKIGFKVKFYPSTEKFLSKKTAIDVPFDVSGIICDLLDPLIMFSAFKRSSNSAFGYSYGDHDFEELLSNVAISMDKEARIKSIKRLSRYFSERPIAVPIFENYVPYFFNTTRVKGFGNQPFGYFVLIDKLITN